MDLSYESKISIKAWAEQDRPREKLLANGRRLLSDAELIAILIGSGNRNESAVELSKRILNHYDNNLNALGKLSVQELCKFKGIGEAKAIAIISALELGRRKKETEIPESDKITSSKEIFSFLTAYFSDLAHEEFWIILLNRANKIITKVLISKGGQSGTVADPKIIFKAALENNATYVVLAHNHPSGNLKPSNADIHLTKKIANAALLLDMVVLDHVIFAERSYFSFADEGLLSN